jgi:hypothetical protein
MKILRYVLFAVIVVMMMSAAVMGQSNIIPIRTDVTGFATWTDVSIAGTTYLQLLITTSSTTTPAMNFDSYTLEKLNYKARTYGTASATECTITISVSTNNGSSWSVITTNLPATSTMTSQTQIDLSPYNGTQVKIKFENLGGTSASSGAGIDDITITGTASSSNSTASDITTFSGYTYPQNINYASYQSTNVVADANDIEIAKFTIRDGGATTDEDALGTTLNSISFSVGNSSNLRRIALYDGIMEVGTEQASASTVTFSGLNLTATDGGTKDFSVRASYNSSVTDNQNILLTVTSAIADIAGSTFAVASAGGATTNNTGDNNKIVVIADRLVFSTNKPPASVIVGQNFNIEVKANDVNGNMDIDQTSSVTLSKVTGAGSISSIAGLTKSLVGGIYSWTDVQYNQSGSLTITASDGVATGLTDVTSNLINSQTNYLDENFDYGISNNTDLLFLTTNWTNHSGTGNPAYDATGLTYSGYSSSGIGGKVTFISSSAGDINRVFPPIITTANVYVSFLVNLSVANANADYFFHLGPTTIGSTFRGKIYARSNSTGWSLSLQKATETAVTDITVLNFNQTYLIILKYIFSTSTTSDDQVGLWVYDSSVPSFEGSGTPIITIALTGSGSTSDPTDIGCVVIRQTTSTPTGSIDGIRVGTTWASTPLPVELTSFTALANPKGAGGHGVELAWKTATEVNNAGFEIEKAVVSNKQSAASWTKIGYVEGHGTTNAPQSYSYNDASASGNVSYRLKQIDRDGKFEYSNTVEVKVGLKAEDFKLTQNYPNPFNPNTTITFAMKTAEQVNVTVYNALGQSVETLFNGIANPNELYSLKFDGKNLSSGTYFYALRSASRNEVRKMLLTK